MNPETIIKAEAKNLGFSLAGITTPDPPNHLEVFESWLTAGLPRRYEVLITG